jgi:hypothetical protein
MEPEHQHSEDENNGDSVTDDADVVERSIASLITHFTNEDNDAKAVVTENDPDYERISKR